MTDWNFADVWETVAEALPGAPATIHAGRRTSWADFDRVADAHAAWLLSLGLERQSSVAQYLYSCPEYLDSVYGCFKAGLVPVNTNHRYGPDELAHVWSDSDARAVVFHGAFTEQIEALRRRGLVPQVRGWLWVDSGDGGCPEWADPVEEVVAARPSRVEPPWPRTGDDLWLLYTGGTTGHPKGVMWRQDDIFSVVNRTAAVRHPEDGDLEDVRAGLTRPGPIVLPAAPLMHGTGMIASFGALGAGGAVATLAGRSFDATEALDVIEAEGVKGMAIVGDAFARPLLAALDEHPERWDISSLRVITSSGVMWSAETKQGLLRHNPRLILVDTLGSSEAIGMASSVSSSDRGAGGTATFALGEGARVLDADDRDVEPGSGTVGVVALPGRGPTGYRGDARKSAETFRVIDGTRYTIPGDHAVVEADGTIVLLGRGSQCVNTGGEKVYPEEVEEVLKTHPAVTDAAVVGVPDERFGQAVTALVVRDGVNPVDAPELIAHVKQALASYKSPRHVVFVDTVRPAANGKLDYRALTALAAAEVSARR